MSIESKRSPEMIHNQPRTDLRKDLTPEQAARALKIGRVEFKSAGAIRRRGPAALGQARNSLAAAGFAFSMTAARKR
jgi:hypothetical protein